MVPLHRRALSRELPFLISAARRFPTSLREVILSVWSRNGGVRAEDLMSELNLLVARLQSVLLRNTKGTEGKQPPQVIIEGNLLEWKG